MKGISVQIDEKFLEKRLGHIPLPHACDNCSMAWNCALLLKGNGSTVLLAAVHHTRALFRREQPSDSCRHTNLEKAQR